jgi:hypothetical protein
MCSKPVMFVVISFLVIALIYGPSRTVNVLAAKIEVGYANSDDCTGSVLEAGGKTCCWSEDTGVDSVVEKFCQRCTHDESSGIVTCNNKFKAKMISSGGNIPMLEEADPTPTTPTPPPGPRSGLGSILPGEGFVQEPSESTPPPQTGEIAPQEVPPAVPGAEPPTEEEADQGTTAAPRTVQPLTKTCPFGNVWNPDWMICVPDVPPLELCPDGSLPQPTGPGGTQPECPSSDTQAFQAEEPEQTPEEEEPEEPEAEGAQQPTEEDGSEESSNSN